MFSLGFAEFMALRDICTQVLDGSRKEQVGAMTRVIEREGCGRASALGRKLALALVTGQFNSLRAFAVFAQMTAAA